jgi:hypothetical protein
MREAMAYSTAAMDASVTTFSELIKLLQGRSEQVRVTRV